MTLRSALTAALLLLHVAPASAQVGPLLWEDDFDSLANWIALEGNGAWGWGNGELQYYSPDNVSIAPLPGEPGNNGLKIDIRQESGPGITDQWGNPLQYTSGRVMSRSKVAVQYGMIEARVRVPDLDLGGWPAFWLLGTTNLAWPRSGEIDMMEMGGKQEYRDLHDTHNGGLGTDDATPNEAVSANALFYTDAAVNPGNPTGAASLSYDPDDLYARPYFDQTDGLVDRFVVYRLYWDDTSLRFVVVDDGVEHDLFATPFTIDEESDEFRAPFYFLINCAVGGAFTDGAILGGGGAPITMPLPAEMYVDYVRVYEWNGQGTVTLGPPEFQQGSVGVFTDNTPTSFALVPTVNAEIYVWEDTLIDGSIEPYEGDNALAWASNGKGWFGAGVMAHQPLNVFDFGEGTLNFRIKIPANVTFEIGIIDAWGNQNYVEFPAFQTKYGLQRDGEWGQAMIPVSDIRGLAMDLRMLSYAFVILERQGTGAEFAIDDVVWDAGVVSDVAASPRRVSLLQNAPNPFNARTEIRFELPAGGTYELAVYDEAGRRVRTFRGLGVSGRNEIAWDGRDDTGAEVASGVYFARVTHGDDDATGAKMVLVK